MLHLQTYVYILIFMELLIGKEIQVYRTVQNIVYIYRIQHTGHTNNNIGNSTLKTNNNTHLKLK